MSGNSNGYGPIPTHVMALGEVIVELGDGLVGPSLVGHGHDGARLIDGVTQVHIINFATGSEQGFQVLLGDQIKNTDVRGAVGVDIELGHGG